MRLVIYIALLSFAGSVSAQNTGFKYGARFGIGQASISDAGIENQTGKLSLNAGLTSAYHFTNYFGLTTDILFVSKGSRATGSETESGFFGSTSYTFEERYKLYYVEIPVMAKASVGNETFRFKIFAGPSVNFNVSGSHTRIFNDPDYDQDHGFTDRSITGIKLLEFAGVVGAGFEVMAGNDIFFIDIRNSAAFNSFGLINNKNAYNNYFAVGVGYMY
jgi:hypothetical protein